MKNLDESSIANGENGWMSQEVINVSVCLISYFFMFCKTNVCHIYQWMVGGLWIDWEIGSNHWWCLKREWKHKLCDDKFWQKRNKGNKTWHTGTWKKNLQTIANGKAKTASGNIEVQARVSYIIYRREINTRSIAPPVKGVSFFSLWGGSYLLYPWGNCCHFYL